MRDLYERFRQMSGTSLAAVLDRQVVPRVFGFVLFSTLLLAAALSIPNIGGYSPIPTTTAMDIWIVCLMGYCLVWGKTEAWLGFLILVMYSATRVFPAIAVGAPLYDFAQAYRWLLYLMVFTLIVGRIWPGVRWLIILTWVLIGTAFVKAVGTFLVLGPGERPGLLTESNFELALFSGLVAVIYRHLRGVERLTIMLLLGGQTVLSGSRSGAIAFLILALFAVTQARRSNLLFRYLGTLAVLAVGLITVSIFESRFAASGRIDRLRFLDVFLSETSDWGPVRWLFGTVPLTPLRFSSCSELSYYEKLFSSAGDGSCYSVILHAFNMRVIFDAGLLGLILSLGVTWYAMRRSGVAVGLAMALLGIAVTNGFSVSGLNNPYVALPIIFAILTANIPPLRSSTKFGYESLVDQTARSDGTGGRRAADPDALHYRLSP